MDVLIPADGPYSLRLAADVRMGPTDYVDDQIWHLRLGGGDPDAIAITSRFGRRIRSMQVFPGFTWAGRSVTSPEYFEGAPMIRKSFPNYAMIECNPFEDLQVIAEYWVSDSHNLAGRISVQNQGMTTKGFQLNLFALLRSGGGSQAMEKVTLRGANVLQGKIGDLTPVLFIEGGATTQPAAYPALTVGQNLEPNESRSWSWSLSNEKNLERSFEKARETVDTNWDGEVAQIHLANARWVIVESGNPDWDSAFRMSQKVALGSMIGPTPRLPFPSPVLSRNPDQGYSPAGDGKEYGTSWAGQEAIPSYIAMKQLLYSNPELAMGVVKNFLYTGSVDGVVDWKPGLGGQRSGMLCVPILAGLSWELYERTEDSVFLRTVYPQLLDFFQSWFEGSYDRDQDGHPEWSHALQAGFEDWSTFDRWTLSGGGFDISKAETPDLLTLLVRECRALILMAETLSMEADLGSLNKQQEELLASFERLWNAEMGAFQQIDRDLHTSNPGELIASESGSFDLKPNRSFEQPIRLMIRVTGPERESKDLKVRLEGRGPRGGKRVETLRARDFQWYWEFGTVTSDLTTDKIDRIHVQGVDDRYSIEVWAPDLTCSDSASLLPIWSLDLESQRAAQIIEQTLLNPDRFYRNYGIPSLSADDEVYAPSERMGPGRILPFHHLLICEGLLEQGYVAESVDFLTRYMNAIVQTLKKEHGFRERYDPETGEGSGDLDHLCGLAPLDLFLKSLGIYLISPRKVQVQVGNPYPWPVTIHWQGLKIQSTPVSVIVTFPDGQIVIVKDENPQILEQLSERTDLS